MSTVRDMLAWLLVLGFISGIFWYSNSLSESTGFESDKVGRCPTDCRYKKHWGPELDPRLSFIGASTPPYCPLHSNRSRDSRG